MKIHFGQVYIQAGASFPFSIGFQRRFSAEISSPGEPSAKFIQNYGADWKFMFRISAKRSTDDNEIRGPAVFKNDTTVEYNIFLPFDTIQLEPNIAASAINSIIQGVCFVIESLGMDSSHIRAQQSRLVQSISADPTMFDSLK